MDSFTWKGLGRTDPVQLGSVAGLQPHANPPKRTQWRGNCFQISSGDWGSWVDAVPLGHPRSACLNSSFHLPLFLHEGCCCCWLRTWPPKDNLHTVGCILGCGISASLLSIHSLLPVLHFSPNWCRMSDLFTLFFGSFVILVAVSNLANC